ncbi:MAG: hypothetical protein Q9181_007222 [Wetmoreana brouardii]
MTEEGKAKSKTFQDLLEEPTSKSKNEGKSEKADLEDLEAETPTTGPHEKIEPPNPESPYATTLVSASESEAISRPATKTLAGKRKARQLEDVPVIGLASDNDQAKEPAQAVPAVKHTPRKTKFPKPPSGKGQSAKTGTTPAKAGKERK